MITKNYKRISLLHTSYKILTTLIMEPLNPCISDIVGEYQCGFKKDISTIDLTRTTRQIPEKHYEYNNNLYLIFVD